MDKKIYIVRKSYWNDDYYCWEDGQAVYITEDYDKAVEYMKKYSKPAITPFFNDDWHWNYADYANEDAKDETKELNYQLVLDIELLEQPEENPWEKIEDKYHRDFAEAKMRYEQEIKFARKFKRSNLYKMLKDLEKNVTDEKIQAVEVEIKAHPELGMYMVKDEDKPKGEVYGWFGTCFKFDSEKMNFGNFFLYYKPDNFDFDKDFERYLRRFHENFDEIYKSNIA